MTEAAMSLGEFPSRPARAPRDAAWRDKIDGEFRHCLAVVQVQAARCPGQLDHVGAFSIDPLSHADKSTNRYPVALPDEAPESQEATDVADGASPVARPCLYLTASCAPRRGRASIATGHGKVV